MQGRRHENYPKAVVVVAVVGIVPVAIRRATVGRIVVPTAAAENTVASGPWPS